ncbi:hypothetical protein QUW13_04555 [Enterococcus hirae]|jgi:cAMP phosphodiesterase|nr:hypothetical protein [Enterococcaceae bacterium]MCI1918937.1 hypothetical protein [Enterococcaceae bacterium]MDM8213138.1 hypothetical protein [Enterococcus hirae]
MKSLSEKYIEDYLTSKIVGITVIDVDIDFPQYENAFHVEGEKDYYLFENNDNHFIFTDGKFNEKYREEENDLDRFFQKVVATITQEEDTPA